MKLIEAGAGKTINVSKGYGYQQPTLYSTMKKMKANFNDSIAFIVQRKEKFAFDSKDKIISIREGTRYYRDYDLRVNVYESIFSEGEVL